MPPEARELVFCHSCEDEWYRDEHGLVCPNPDCGSDVVEIIDPQSDPRRQEPESQPTQHPLHNHDPWNTDAPDPDEADISEATFRSNTHSPHGQGPMPHPWGTLFDSMFGGGMQQAQSLPGSTAENGTHQTVRGTGGSWSTSGSYSVTMSSGPRGVRITRTTFPPGGGATPGNPADDLMGILGHMAQIMNVPPNARNGQMPPMFPAMGIFPGGLGGLPGGHGDVAWTQEGFDRILTMLRDQHGGSEGAPPAAEEAIAALPKVKISKEHLDEQNKAECSICMDPVSLGEEVTILPCNHWFHGECIKSWLKEHDTCPQCRRGITPRDGNQNQPRTTGQAPRNWQVNEGDLDSFLGRESQQPGDSSGGIGQASNSSEGQGSSSRSTSVRGGMLAAAASSILRRLAGSGSSGGTGSTDGSGSSPNNGNNSDRNNSREGETR